MNKSDTAYFEAISAAGEGRLDIGKLHDIYTEASKFKQLQEAEESARHFERLFSIMRTLQEQTAGGALLAKYVDFCRSVMSEYMELLVALERDERASTVRKFVLTI